MTSLIAMMKREYLEHRGAFLYAPLLILGLLLAFIVSATVSGRLEGHAELGIVSSLKLFEIGFLGAGMLWFVYLMVTLFFYYADAFSADRRNNAMLFWKSMPLTDFKVLGSKMLSGMMLFPALIFMAFLISGVLVFIGTLVASFTLSGLVVSSPVGYAGAAVQVALYQLAYLVLAMLWYAPFFAWVGMLSTAFGRWSIPLALLTPGMVALAENLLFDFGGPDGGYVLSYLKWRLQFGFDGEQMLPVLISADGFDAGAMIGLLMETIDFAQLAGGLAVAALFVFAASEYRRRANPT